MEGNQFVSKETVAYLQSQLNQTTPQRLESAETNIVQIIQFLKEYEPYVETCLANQTAAIDSVNKDVQYYEKVRLNTIEQLSDFTNQLAALTKSYNRALYTAYFASALAVGIVTGVFVWLTR